MLEDMIAVGPPKTARENYWSYLPGKSQKKIEEKEKVQTKNYTQTSYDI